MRAEPRVRPHHAQVTNPKALQRQRRRIIQPRVDRSSDLPSAPFPKHTHNAEGVAQTPPNMTTLLPSLAQPSQVHQNGEIGLPFAHAEAQRYHRGMLHAIRIAGLILSLLACSLAIVMWMRSYRQFDDGFLTSSGSVGVYSVQGLNTFVIIASDKIQ